jgi:hypothetical protein
MAGWTYGTLQEAIQNYTEYREDSFVANIPNFIQSAEDRIFFGVDLQYFRKNVAGNLSASNQFLAAPADFYSSFALAVTGPSGKVWLLQKDSEYMTEYNPTGATGFPKYYGLFDDMNFLLAPVPDQNYPTELHYYYKPESIVTAGTTWLGTNAPDAMLYGSLVEAYTYMKGDKDIMDNYNQRYLEALTRLKNYGEGREDIDAYRDGLIRVKAT